MKRFVTGIISFCVVSILLPCFAFAQQPDVTFEPAFDMPGEKLEVSSNKITLSMMSETQALPSSFDARDMGWVTPVKKQLSGTCWAHAAISTIESNNIARGLCYNTVDYSEAHLVWSANTRTKDLSDTNCDDYRNSEDPYNAGNSFSRISGILSKWSGIALEEDFPISEDFPLFDDSQRYNTGSGYVVESIELFHNIEDIKRWLMEYGSASVTFNNTSYYSVNIEKYRNPDAPTCAYWNYEYEQNVTSHSVAIIGWDDSFPMREITSIYEKYGYPEYMPPADGAWLCKDSNNGYYTWLSYYDPTLREFTGYITQPADTYRENYTYNGSGYSEIAKMPFDTPVANVFETDEYELLSAISTYTSSPDQPLKISIYTNLNSDYSTPVEGTLALEMSTTVRNAGYHTIKLPENIPLEPNAYFSVVVDYSTVDGYAIIPMERNSDYAASYDLTYASKPRQSYVYFQTKASWRTNTQFGIENVLIQAFTNCDHQPETTITESTCKESGYSETKCTQCSEVLEAKVISKAEHSYKWNVETAPTATENGCKKQICSSCGEKSGETETIPATGFEPTNGIVVDYSSNTVYGLAAGISSLDNYTNIVVDGFKWFYEQGKYGFGTGSKAILKNGDITVGEYTILIYGDVNGDGWYDGEDAFLVNLIAKGMLDRDDVGEAIWTAADCNHDGKINEADVDLLSGAGLKLNDVDQNKSIAELATNADYIEYVMLIDQSAGVHTGSIPYEDIDNTAQGTTSPKANGAVESDIFTTENNAEVIITTLFEFIKRILAIVFSFLKP